MSTPRKVASRATIERDLDRLLGAPQHLGEVVVAEVVGAEGCSHDGAWLASGVTVR